MYNPEKPKLKLDALLLPSWERHSWIPTPMGRITQTYTWDEPISPTPLLRTNEDQK